MFSSSSVPEEPAAPFLPVEKMTATTRPVLMIWFAPAAPQLGGEAPAFRAGDAGAVPDLQTSRSFGWQVMPFCFRRTALVKCGSVEVPEQFVTVRATAYRILLP